MATRMKVLGIKAAVVGGRVRDLRELQATELPVCLANLVRWLILIYVLDLGSRNVDCWDGR